MDISNLVDYEKLHRLELLHPVTEKPLGITMDVRSIGSAAVERVLLEHTNKQIGRFAKNKLPTAEQGKRAEIERTAACIAAWNWGDQNFNGTRPELTMKAAVEVMSVSWIERQVRAAAEAEQNFTMSSPPDSAG